MFRSKRWLLLFAALALVLVVAAAGFAFSRGYFMRFIVDGVELSRDQFLALAESSADNQTVAYCAGGEFSFNEGYMIRCFDTHEEVSAYLVRKGS